MRWFDWGGLQSYWADRYRGVSHSDLEDDPDGLSFVCQSDIPPLNRYYARSQQRAMLSILKPLLPPVRGATALDVGCGAGRWCRLLTKLGYTVTGIDLEEELIETNRERDKDGISYQVSAIQDYRSEQSADLVTTVTVLQHLPYGEQATAVDSIVRTLRPGGHVAILENISDIASPIVFANSVDGWTRLFETRGLRLLRTVPYDYSPALRSYYAMSRRVRSRRGARASGPKGASAPNDPGTPTGRDVLRVVDQALRVTASKVDTVLEPLVAEIGLPLSTGHCALLFGSDP